MMACKHEGIVMGQEQMSAKNFYFERPVIEARNQIASEVAKDYLEEVAFLKCEGKEPKD